MRPSDDPSWSRYGQTILELGEGPLVAIDLRLPVHSEARATLAGLGLGAGFGVLTACNPRGRDVDAATNAWLHAGLVLRLAHDGDRYVRCDGVSLDGSHRETGVAIAQDEGYCVALARELEQSAIYWWDGEAFWLVPVLVESRRLRLPAG